MIYVVFQDICNFECLDCGEEKARIRSELAGAKGELILGQIDAKREIRYAPVGNYPEEPVVIICGKTTSKTAYEKFLYDLSDGGYSFHEACVRNAFNSSAMRKNLFTYLDAIGLFDRLATEVPYWRRQEPRYDMWVRLFSNVDDSVVSGIQFTQAFNCAILKKVRNATGEPSKRVFNLPPIQRCLFRTFRVTPKLKLVIFLDTPFDYYRFHQVNYYHLPQPSISITHPSKQNQDIFNSIGDSWDGTAFDEWRANFAVVGTQAHIEAYLLTANGVSEIKI